MKKCILAIAALVIFLAGGAAAENIRESNFAAYVAGVELIISDKSLNPQEQARRYRRLCAITGVSGEKAKAFILQYKTDPAGWQKFETMVMELLQNKGKART
jgi:hypothetical protein